METQQLSFLKEIKVKIVILKQYIVLMREDGEQEVQIFLAQKIILKHYFLIYIGQMDG